MEQYVKSDRFIQLDGSHLPTDQAKLEEEQLLDLVRGGWDTCELIARNFAFKLTRGTHRRAAQPGERKSVWEGALLISSTCLSRPTAGSRDWRLKGANCDSGGKLGTFS